MIVGCLGSILFIALIIWAFGVSPILGVSSILVGFALIIWKTSILRFLGFALIVALIVWAFKIHWILGVVFIFIGLLIIGWDEEKKEEERAKELTIKNLMMK
ncbi:hypothetical protein ACW2QC_15320 [Virgibacillus sp. FSP13]